MDPASIIALVTAATKLIELAVKARDRARATGEMTPEQDAEFDAALEATFKQDHWKL
jgi:hypothetical protein